MQSDDSYYCSLGKKGTNKVVSVSGWLGQTKWMLQLLFGCGHTHTSILEQKLWETEELIFWDHWRTLRFPRTRIIGELTMKPEKTGLDCFWRVSGSLFLYCEERLCIRLAKWCIWIWVILASASQESFHLAVAWFSFLVFWGMCVYEMVDGDWWKRIDETCSYAGYLFRMRGRTKWRSGGRPLQHESNREDR